MWIVNLEANPNGSHNDHRADHITAVPDGWAMIPDDFTVPSTFPFVGIEAEDVTFYREVEVEKEVIKTREVESFVEVVKTREVESVDEEGNPVTVTEEYTEFEPTTITEEYTEMETVIEEVPYTVHTVVAMTEGVVPEPVPEHNEPTIDERVTSLEAALIATDETAIELYEAMMAQEEINTAQDDALIELYEMIGG